MRIVSTAILAVMVLSASAREGLPVMRVLERFGAPVRKKAVRYAPNIVAAGGKFARIENHADCQNGYLSVAIMPDNSFDGSDWARNGDRPYGALEVRACGLEKSLVSQKLPSLVKMAVSPGDEAGIVRVGYAIDMVAATNLGVTAFDIRLSMPKNTQPLVRSADGSVFSAYGEGNAKSFKLLLPADLAKACRVQDVKADGKFLCQHAVWRVSATEGKATDSVGLDFGCTPATARKTQPYYGEVDFDLVDFLHVPIRPTRNLLVNGGFEQGLKGWKFHFPHAVELKPYAKALENGGRLYEEIVGDAKFGSKACLLRAMPPGTPSDGLSSLPLSIYPERSYVLSGWTKWRGDKDAYVAFRICCPMKGGGVLGLKGTGNPSVQVNAGHKDEWRRFELPFVCSNGVVEIAFNGRGMLLDGLMVEEGDKATDTVDDPLVAHFVTSDPDNDLKAGVDCDAHVEVSCFDNRRPVPAGTSVRVRIHDFYHDVVYDRTFDVIKEGRIPLDLDAERIGQGVFVVRYDFTVPGKQVAHTWTDYERFSIMDALDNDHPTAFFFVHYPWFQTHGSLGPRLTNWMRARGIGSTSWPRCADRASSPLRELYATGKFKSGLHVFEHDLRRRHPDKFGKAGTLVREFTKEPTEERLDFIRKEAYEIGKVCDSADTSWCFSNEEEEKFPLVNGKPDFDGYFRFQKAAYDGLKKALDERGLKLRYAPTHGMCQFNPSGLHRRGTFRDRRWVFESLLDAAHRAGFHYNLLSMHLYWAVDGTIAQRWRRSDVGTSIFDRNEDAEALFAIARKYGYGEDVPVRFEEGFNTLPFYIPQWNAHGWADDYDSVSPSLAMGNMEFVQASAIARQYLMDLRWWPRVETSHIWQHRPVMDMALTPWMWTKVSNTIGHLLPDPRGITAVKLENDVRAFVFEQGELGVMAIWTTDNLVELARKEAPVLELQLPQDSSFVDLMGNHRTVSGWKGGKIAVPITPAPLFVKSGDAYALARSVVRAKRMEHE